MQTERDGLMEIKKGIRGELPHGDTREKKHLFGICEQPSPDLQKSKIDFEIKMLHKFMKIENEVGVVEEDESSSDNSKRRKRWLSHKGFELINVSGKSWIEDREQIYGPVPEGISEHNTMGLKKDEKVVCILGKRKYKGMVIQVNLRGVVVKTEDRKRIKLLWENIDWKKVNIMRADDTI